MTWLYEQPLVIVVIGIVVLLGLGVAWSSTGRKELAIAAGLALLLVIVALAIERLVVTDGEAIRQTLQEIAHDVATNNHRALLRHIADSAPELKQRANKEMPNYKFTDCRVTRIHNIQIDAGGAPKAAVVEFNVVASGSFHYEGMDLNDSNVARWVRLHFVKDKDGRWKVEDYQHDDPQRMIMNRPAGP